MSEAGILLLVLPLSDSTMLWLRLHFKSILLVAFSLLAFIIFEAFQQQFYAENFGNGILVEFSIWDFFLVGLKRWTIWVSLSSVLIWFVAKFPLKGNVNHSHLVLSYGLIMVLLLLADVALAALLNMWELGQSGFETFSELYYYYFFHKAPIIFVSLMLTVLLVNYFTLRQRVELQVRKLGRLEESNLQLAEQLERKKDRLSEESMVIQVKVGHRTKVIALEAILWVQSYDYCVKIHTQNDESFTLRSSLKKLEELLPNDQFMRIHRTAIVRLDAIDSYYQNGRAYVVLSNGEEVPVAQAQMRQLKSISSFPA